MSEALVQFFMQQSQATYAQDQFAVTAILGVMAIVLLIAVAFYSNIRGRQENGENDNEGRWIGFVVCLTVLFILGVCACTNYNEMLQIQTSPGGWALKKAAEFVGRM